MDEPDVKRAVAFFDGQNLYHHAKAAFGHNHPNYHVVNLFNAVCEASGWAPRGVRFYTGVASSKNDPFWHGYWARRLLVMRREGVLVVDRPLRYYAAEITLEDGTVQVVESPQEKGIDVRLALDVIRLTLSKQFDVVVIFSQDNDLAEVVEDVKEIARTHDRWIKIVSAFPDSVTASAKRGIERTDWFKMDRAFYDACLDDRDYRPPY